MASMIEDVEHRRHTGLTLRQLFDGSPEQAIRFIRLLDAGRGDGYKKLRHVFDNFSRAAPMVVRETVDLTVDVGDQSCL